MSEVINFFVVLACAVGIASGMSILYATGVRLWINSENGEAAAKRVGAFVCFGACIVLIIFALYLIIPVFHQ